MHCFSKSLIVIRRYHHFTHRAANRCWQSLNNHNLAKNRRIAGAHKFQYIPDSKKRESIEHYFIGYIYMYIF